MPELKATANLLEALVPKYRDQFVAPHISDLTECGAEPVWEERPRHREWVKAYILNSVLRSRWTGQMHQQVSVFLRKVQGAFEEYEEGRESLVRFFDTNRGSFTPYQQAVRRFGTTLSLVYQSYMIVYKVTGEKQYDAGDNSPLDIVSKLYNYRKHVEGMIVSQQGMPEEYTAPLWITNHGLGGPSAELRFEELRTLLLELGNDANNLIDPAEFAERIGPDDAA